MIYSTRIKLRFTYVINGFQLSKLMKGRTTKRTIDNNDRADNNYVCYTIRQFALCELWPGSGLVQFDPVNPVRSGRKQQ